MCERKLVHVQSCSCRGTKTHLSVLKLHIKEVKVPEDSELLLRGGVVHVVRLPGPFIGGHQAGLVLHEVQLPTAGEDHLYRETKRKNMIRAIFRCNDAQKVSSHCDYVARLTEGFFVSPTSCPHKDKTFTSFSRVLFCRGREEMETLWAKLGCHNSISLKPHNTFIPNQISRRLSQKLAVSADSNCNAFCMNAFNMCFL